MKEQIYALDLAGRSVKCLLRWAGTEKYLDAFAPAPLRLCTGEDYDVFVTDQLIAQDRALYPANVKETWLEYKLLLWPVADYLLSLQACIVHAVAFCWRGKAWLLCGPSGTGKTTQFVRWTQLCAEEIRLLSGDMPVVTMSPDGTPLVWASAWTGKERWVGTPGPVELGGVVFLEQAKENEINRLANAEAVKRMMGSFASWPETERDIPHLEKLANGILTRPSWLLRNRGDMASASMTMNAFLAERGTESETV